jgi:GNAT superfamily N-acetyltransferase
MIEVRTVIGPEVGPHLDDIARLRIEVFRAFPYCYDGDVGYEREYLATYARSAESLFVLAFDAARVIGAATGVPLADEVEAFQAPWRAQGYAPNEVFYFGESVLLPAYRGQGLGHRFFDEREAYARRLGRFRWTAFCAVLRADDDPRRPPDYRPLDAFWRARGYTRQTAMRARLAWKEVGHDAPVENELMFWLHPLDAA